MIRNSQGKTLGIQDAETLAGFLLYHMNAELRVKLMAEHPTVYARVFPEVSEERILDIVRGQIRDDRENRKDK